MTRAWLAVALVSGCTFVGSYYVPEAPPKLERSRTSPAAVRAATGGLYVVSQEAPRNLRLTRYRGLALPATDLLADRTGLTPKSATITFDHGTSRYAPADEGDLMILIDGAGGPPPVRRIGDPNHAARGLDRFEPTSLRLLLGHGLDNLAAWNLQTNPESVQVWVGVRDKTGAWVDGPAYLRAALKTRSLDLLKDLTVFAKSTGKERMPAYYAARFTDVVVAAQMDYGPGGWSWIGFGRARMEGEAGATDGPRFPLDTELVWREFKPGKEAHVEDRYRVTGASLGDFLVDALMDVLEDQIEGD